MPDTNLPTTAIYPDAPVGARKVDVRRGSLDGSVSSQWFSRPADERFLSLEDLMASVRGRHQRSHVNTYSTASLSVKADLDDPASLRLLTVDGEMTPNHWSFGQLCTRVKTQAGFIRDLLGSRVRGPDGDIVPFPLAPLVLQDRLIRSPAEVVKVMRTINEDGSPAEMRAVTGPDYGRIWDEEVVDAVMRICGDGTWKVPGVINWSNGTYDPNAHISSESTTLYASDRDVFMFLCRDQYPIEVGKLANGDPDLMFPGVIVSNSETGAGSLRIDTMYLRAVCMNRNLWGVEKKNSIAFRHTKNLPTRFQYEVKPALAEFSRISASAVAAKVAEAKRIRVGDNDDEVSEFIMKQGHSKKAAADIMSSVFGEEGHKARSLWDVVNGITAKARTVVHQDARVALEREAGQLMAKVTV